MSVRTIVLIFLLITLSCSSPAPQSAKTEAKPSVPTHPAPKDIGTKFPSTGQVNMQLVPDHLLGKDFMPGGNLADYKTALGEYQMFLLQQSDPHTAAFILLDWKAAMPDAKYLAHMGGYYGTLDGKPVYVFSKGPYLAGLVGLTEDKADPEARRFAARIPAN